MTRDEAIAIYRESGLRHIEIDFRDKFPQGLCDRMLYECAIDTVDGLIALGILKIDVSPDTK